MTGIRAERGQYLDDDTIMRYAPSVFVGLRHPDRSSSYRHVATFEVLNRLRDNGFAPVSASQSGDDADRIQGLFARHSIRFRQTDAPDVKQGDIIPELLLLNAHDGSGSYELSAGLFRILCLNGLVAGCGDLFRVKVRHGGNVDIPSRVLAASEKIIDALPILLGRVDRLRGVELDEDRRLTFARAARKLVPSSLAIDASELLSPRRADDMGTDAWTTLNVVQENIVRGGVLAIDKRGSIRRTASISDVERDAYINRALWDLAEAA